MKLGRASILGLMAILGLTPPGRAQVPAPPAPPTAVSPFAAGAPAAAAAAVAPAAAAAPPQATLWGFLGLSKANCAACKDKICNSQLGVLLNNAAAPASALTGGLIPPFCPPVPNAAELAAIAEHAAREAGAGAGRRPDQGGRGRRQGAGRRRRVSGDRRLPLLARGDEQLINSLRADRNECVRFAAARVLSSGCCCNKETIEALKHSATGSDEDNNPEERSPRVRAAAEIALHNCLMSYTEPPTAPEPAPERPPIVPPEGGVVPPESPATPEEMDLDEPPQEDGTQTGGWDRPARRRPRVWDLERRWDQVERVLPPGEPEADGPGAVRGPPGVAEARAEPPARADDGPAQLLPRHDGGQAASRRPDDRGFPAAPRLLRPGRRAIV